MRNTDPGLLKKKLVFMKYVCPVILGLLSVSTANVIVVSNPPRADCCIWLVASEVALFSGACFYGWMGGKNSLILAVYGVFVSVGGLPLADAVFHYLLPPVAAGWPLFLLLSWCFCHALVCAYVPRVSSNH